MRTKSRLISRRNFLTGVSSLGVLYAVRDLALPAASPGKSAAFANLDDFFRDFAAEWVRFNPNLATAIRYFTGDEQERLERQLTPETFGWRRDRIRLARRGLAGLAKFDRDRISEKERVSADVMQWELEILAAEEPYLDYTFPLEQFRGANARLPYQLTVVHPLLNEKDTENYVAALGQVSTRMEEAIAEARAIAAKGILPPRFILQSTIQQMQSFVSTPPAQNPLVTAFAQKMAAVKSIGETRREQFSAEAEKIVAAQVYPAWMKAIALLESQLARATDDAGVWRFKAGPEIYAYGLRRYTTTNLTPDQIHEVGLQQANSIEAQMDGLLRRLGRTEGSVKDRIEKLSADLRYPNPASEESRTQIMKDIDGILSDAQRRAALLFDKRPKAPVVAQPYPRFSEANQAASYTSPAIDGSRPGTFQFPRRVDQMTKFGLRSLVYHETVPGHHFQVALELEDTALPRFRQVGAFGIISALTEG
jgi:uncharacterized protein (DUF885 family)